MRLSSKRELDKDALINEIRAAGHENFSIEAVTVLPELLGKNIYSRVTLCGSCGEAYSENGIKLCPACQGMNICG